MTIHHLNYYSWFGDRRLDFTPIHFHVCRAELTQSSLDWIDENLTGRYSIHTVEDDDLFLFTKRYPAFEDPQEAVHYELMWS